ncbi:hypothetical protein [Brucella intermedia]|uniref:hypothetical protein n=1 Tax=Brucella intermedia TaxID=94625 RepID=UPI00128E6D00|nr:hypothetical protein [Brucella intermedia]
MASELKPVKVTVFFPSDMDISIDRASWYLENAIRGHWQSFAHDSDPIRGMARASVAVFPHDADTRPAPAATDTGLETELAYKFWSVHPNEIDEFLVTHPMPENYKGGGRAWFFEHHMRELLAAELAENERLRRIIEVEGPVTHWKNRAEKAEADNAAKDARIKELEEEVEWAQNAVLARQRHAEARCEALEAKLAAAEKALETYRSTVKGVCESQRGTKWGKAAECIFDAIERAVLEVKSS